MTKIEFMKDLKKALQWSFTPEETQDILTDYEGFFVSENADKPKTEAQICAELGDPRDIALELSGGDNKKLVKHTWTQTAIHMFYTLFAAVVVYAGSVFMYIGMMSEVYGTQISGTVVFAATVFVLWALAFRNFENPRKIQGKAKVAFFACHGLIAAILIPYFLSWQLTEFGNRWHEYLSAFSLLTTLILAVGAVIGFRYSGRQWFTVTAHALGFFAVYATPNVVWVDDEFAKVTINYEAYIFAVVVTIIFAVIIRKSRKAVK
jgi:uncharacterized membrane protein